MHAHVDPAQRQSENALGQRHSVKSERRAHWPTILVVLRVSCGALAVVGLYLWMISYRVESPALFHPSTAVVVYVEDGWVCLGRVPEWGAMLSRLRRPFDTGTICHMGRCFRDRQGHIGRLPLHVLVLFMSGFASYSFFPVYRRWERRRNGLCVKCCYDLTGNVSGVCPECGCPTEILGKESCDMDPEEE